MGIKSRQLNLKRTQEGSGPGAEFASPKMKKKDSSMRHLQVCPIAQRGGGVYYNEKHKWGLHWDAPKAR